MYNVRLSLSESFLKQLGIFGFDALEPLILAALVSKDPLLLIGKSGTGKTTLLNRISQALGLHHRHYNASLVSFDDLIGFPRPGADGKSIEFLQTPATIWNAESVLIDELSRCKPEVQNKFFSIIYEKNIQGMALEDLTYRWAAMNPFRYEGEGEEEHYSGSQPLDPALADRFGFIIEVPDWQSLDEDEQEAVLLNYIPEPEGKEGDTLAGLIEKIRPQFHGALEQPSAGIIKYVRLVSCLLNEAGMRISPRRAQMLVRNIISYESVLHFSSPESKDQDSLPHYKKVLSASLPQRAFREDFPVHLIDSVHSEVVRLMRQGHEKERWISEFFIKKDLPARIEMLFNPEVDKEIKSLGLIQLLTREPMEKKAAFSFAVYPIMAELQLVNQEALDELLTVASGIMNIDSQLEWYEAVEQQDSIHPGWKTCERIIFSIPYTQNLRILRAKQLFLFLLTGDYPISDPVNLEFELHTCFEKVRELLAQKEKSND